MKASITEISDNQVDRVVFNVVEQLVGHYNQEIHTVDNEYVSLPKENLKTDRVLVSVVEDGEEKAPSLPSSEDPSSEDPPPEQLPAVLAHLLDRLWQSTQNSQTAAVVAAGALLQSYKSQIRSVLFGRKRPPLQDQIGLLSQGHAVLVHFERLVRHYLIKVSSLQWDTNLTEDFGKRNKWEVLEQLSSDITLLTAGYLYEKTTDDGETTASSRLFSTDPRRLYEAIDSLWCLVHSFLNIHKVSLKDYTNKEDEERDKAIRRCMCSLLAFGPDLDIREVEPHLTKLTLLQNDLSEFWAYPPINLDLTDVFGHENGVPMNWNAFVSSATMWNAGRSTQVDQIWKLLAALTLEENQLGENSLKETKQALLSHFDWVLMAKSLRSHFSGKDMIYDLHDDELIIPRQRLHLGHLVEISPAQQLEKLEKDVLDKPFQGFPSRLHAALQVVSLFEGRNCDASVNTEFFQQLLPICYELLNGSNDTIIGMGAVLTFRLLNILQKTDKSSPNVEYAIDNILLALGNEITLGRDGTALTFLALAQRRALFLKSDATDQRRRATQQWIVLLSKVRHAPDNPTLIWAIVASLIPLLYDHTLNSNADALELGRPGLAVLLPLIRQDHEGEETFYHETRHDRDVVPILALQALSNLLVGAHPIMKHHTQKILCELLACLAHRSTEYPGKTDKKRHLFLHVAGMAVVICGDRAVDFLDQLLDSPDYNDELKNCVREVQVFAAQLPRRSPSKDR